MPQEVDLVITEVDGDRVTVSDMNLEERSGGEARRDVL